ncbi:Rieske 2Fe-2S domain-containing protein [Brasilonema sp. UFV-L1]|uniref:Rieske 2Fe-2S domain-containing protein n=1 Tax=Brasilonema sp. UFV-L1 TaxID=2234130 RepID=UPI00145C5892|nr:Rieske 2Fe-2S domain-containing protein [Brasilonema sp. UFV-L1]
MKSVERKSRFPFTSFPNGWFRVAYSNEIKPGEIKPLRYFGKDLVLFRTKSGTPYVFDAHCPHLGAHIGYGGKVKGENIQCPFHEWCFDGNGRCTATPHTNRQPPAAQIQKWLVSEINGVILVYHHSEGIPPTWEIPNLSEYTGGVPFRKVKQWTVRTHAQEIGENGCDMSHLMVVHDIANVTSPPKSQSMEFDGAVAVNRVYVGYAPSFPEVWIMGEEVNGLSILRHYGLGCIFTTLSAKGKINFRWMHIYWITPVDEEYCDIHLAFGIPNLFRSPLAHAIAVATSKDIQRLIEQDFPILENKAYHSNALLYDEDGPIAKFRRWARQFYSDVPSPNPNTNLTAAISSTHTQSEDLMTRPL